MSASEAFSYHHITANLERLGSRSEQGIRNGSSLLSRSLGELEVGVEKYHWDGRNKKNMEMTRKTNGQIWGKEMCGLSIISLLESIAPICTP